MWDLNSPARGPPGKSHDTCFISRYPNTYKQSFWSSTNTSSWVDIFLGSCFNLPYEVNCCYLKKNLAEILALRWKENLALWFQPLVSTDHKEYTTQSVQSSLVYKSWFYLGSNKHKEGRSVSRILRKKHSLGTSLVVQRLRLWASNVGDEGLFLGQRTRSQLKVHMLQWRPGAAK